MNIKRKELFQAKDTSHRVPRNATVARIENARLHTVLKLSNALENQCANDDSSEKVDDDNGTERSTPVDRGKQTVSQQVAADDQRAMENASGIPVKRGRGRPRKPPKPADEAPKDVVKRGRGRPRKFPIVVKPPPPDGVKRGRGRPRKIIVNDSQPNGESNAKAKEADDIRVAQASEAVVLQANDAAVVQAIEAPLEQAKDAPADAVPADAVPARRVSLARKAKAQSPKKLIVRRSSRSKKKTTLINISDPKSLAKQAASATSKRVLRSNAVIDLASSDDEPPKTKERKAKAIEEEQRPTKRLKVEVKAVQPPIHNKPIEILERRQLRSMSKAQVVAAPSTQVSTIGKKRHRPVKAASGSSQETMTARKRRRSLRLATIVVLSDDEQVDEPSSHNEKQDAPDCKQDTKNEAPSRPEPKAETLPEEDKSPFHSITPQVLEAMEEHILEAMEVHVLETAEHNKERAQDIEKCDPRQEDEANQPEKVEAELVEDAKEIGEVEKEAEPEPTSHDPIVAPVDSPPSTDKPMEVTKQEEPCPNTWTEPPKACAFPPIVISISDDEAPMRRRKKQKPVIKHDPYAPPPIVIEDSDEEEDIVCIKHLQPKPCIAEQLKVHASLESLEDDIDPWAIRI